MGYKGLQLVTVSYKGLNRLKKVTEGFEGLNGYKG